MGTPTATMVLTLIVKQDGPTTRVLLGKKKRGFGVGKLVAPGGHIEAGETPRRAAVRETHEEVGLQLQPTQLREGALIDCSFPYRPHWSTVVAVFLAQAPGRAPRGGDELDPVWYDTADLPLSQMWDEDRFWLGRVLAGERLWGSFVYGPDNATVEQAHLRALPHAALN